MPVADLAADIHVDQGHATERAPDEINPAEPPVGDVNVAGPGVSQVDVFNRDPVSFPPAMSAIRRASSRPPRFVQAQWRVAKHGGLSRSATRRRHCVISHAWDPFFADKSSPADRHRKGVPLVRDRWPSWPGRWSHPRPGRTDQQDRRSPPTVHLPRTHELGRRSERASEAAQRDPPMPWTRPARGLCRESTVTAPALLRRLC